MVFKGRSAEAGLDLTLSLSRQSVTKTQMSHLETSDAVSVQSKDVWNENLEFLMSSAGCLLSADSVSKPQMSHLETSNGDSAQSRCLE